NLGVPPRARHARSGDDRTAGKSGAGLVFGRETRVFSDHSQWCQRHLSVVAIGRRSAVAAQRDGVSLGSVWRRIVAVLLPAWRKDARGSVGTGARRNVAGPAVPGSQFAIRRDRRGSVP